MTRRAALSVALGALGAAALIGLYLGLVTWAQGPEHALELLWGDRLFVGLISAGFGTQVGLFTYLRLLQRAMARESVALAGAGTATSSVSMVACCAHHIADVLPLVGLSGLAVFLDRPRRLRHGRDAVLLPGLGAHRGWPDRRGCADFAEPVARLMTVPIARNGYPDGYPRFARRLAAMKSREFSNEISSPDGIRTHDLFLER